MSVWVFCFVLFSVIFSWPRIKQLALPASPYQKPYSLKSWNSSLVSAPAIRLTPWRMQALPIKTRILGRQVLSVLC